MLSEPKIEITYADNTVRITLSGLGPAPPSDAAMLEQIVPIPKIAAPVRSAKNAPREWTRDELVLLTDQYLKMGGVWNGKQVSALAKILDHTKTAVTVKLQHLRHFEDPNSGLKNGSKFSREIWDELADPERRAKAVAEVK